MQKMKSSGKGSFLRSILRALGIDTRAQGSTLPLPSQSETRPSVSVRYSNYIDALRKAEQANASAIMELRRKQLLAGVY